MKLTHGAQFEISLDGVPRSYRDRRTSPAWRADSRSPEIPPGVSGKTCTPRKKSSSRSSQGNNNRRNEPFSNMSAEEELDVHAQH